MKIQIEDKWYLCSDERQFMLSEEKERDVTDKETGKKFKERFMHHKTFHNTVEQVIKEYCNMKLGKSSISSWEGLIKKQKEYDTQFRTLLKTCLHSIVKEYGKNIDINKIINEKVSTLKKEAEDIIDKYIQTNFKDYGKDIVNALQNKHDEILKVLEVKK